MADSDIKIIQGFRTTKGIAKYDFNSLANVPSLMKVIYCEGVLPPPTAQYEGTIALITNAEQTDMPFICFQKTKGQYVWHSFNGTHAVTANQLETPTIVLEEDGV